MVLGQQERGTVALPAADRTRISEGQNGRADGDFFRRSKTKNGKPHWVYLSNAAKVQLRTQFDLTPTNVQAWVRRRQKAHEEAWPDLIDNVTYKVTLLHD
jgi:hypothetical protein